MKTLSIVMKTLLNVMRQMSDEMQRRLNQSKYTSIVQVILVYYDIMLTIILSTTIVRSNQLVSSLHFYDLQWYLFQTSTHSYCYIV